MSDPIKHNFNFSLISKDGNFHSTISKNDEQIKAVHQKNAISILKIKFPGCKIITVKPDINKIVGAEKQFYIEKSDRKFEQ